MSQSSPPSRTVHLPEGTVAVGTYTVDRPLEPSFRAIVFDVPGRGRLDLQVHPSVAPLIVAALAGQFAVPAELGPEQEPAPRCDNCGRTGPVGSHLYGMRVCASCGPDTAGAELTGDAPQIPNPRPEPTP